MNKQYFLKLLSKKLSGELAVGKEQQLQQAIEENGEYKQIADALTLYFHNKNENQSAPDDKLVSTPYKLDCFLKRVNLF